MNLKKPVNNFKSSFFSKLKNGCRSDEEIERTKDNIKNFYTTKGEKSTKLLLKMMLIYLETMFLRYLWKYP